MAFLKFIFRTFVGLLVIFVGLSMFLGKFEDAACLLAAAVICTAGLGLIVIIPVSYMLGLAITIWWIPFGDSKRPGTSALFTRNSAFGRAIESYVRDARRDGIPDELIKARCLRNGATEEDIQRVLASTAG